MLSSSHDAERFSTIHAIVCICLQTGANHIGPVCSAPGGCAWDVCVCSVRCGEGQDDARGASDGLVSHRREDPTNAKLAMLPTPHPRRRSQRARALVCILTARHRCSHILVAPASNLAVHPDIANLVDKFKADLIALTARSERPLTAAQRTAIARQDRLSVVTEELRVARAELAELRGRNAV